MKERPILFSAPMVRSILEGRKTQTRRIVKPQPALSCDVDSETCCELMARGCPYGTVGDRLWVRETFRVIPIVGTAQFCTTGPFSDFKADYNSDTFPCQNVKWRPSIYMPRWASRITLEITGVRVERLQDITENDATSEGLIYEAGVWSIDGKDRQTIARCVDPRHTYEALWKAINGPDSWSENPFVWVVEFKTVEKRGAE